MADDFNPDDLMTAPAPAAASMKIKPETTTAAPDPTISSAMRGVLDSVIAPGESSGKYNIIYGGKEFSDLSQHPDVHVPITTGPNAGLYSTAAGKYQFIKSTWDEAANATGRHDFSPESQDINAAWLAARTYKQATGRDIEADYASGDPKLREGIKRALASQWESLGKPGPRVDKLWTLGNDKFRFSDEALTAHDDAEDTSTVYMHPEHYLTLSPSMDDDPSHSVTGGQALRSSLAKGEPVNNIPHLTLDENGKVVSQDGRSRALMANMAGVDAIPVALKNISQLPDRLTGASGNVVQTAGMTPKDQVTAEKSGSSIMGRLLGIGSAQAAEPTDPNLEAVEGNPFAGADPKLEAVEGNPFEAGQPMSRAERVGTGMLDPAYGLGQLEAHDLPDVRRAALEAMPSGMAAKLGGVPEPAATIADRTVRQREAGIAATTPKDATTVLGQDVYRTGGNILSPANLIAPTKALGAGGLVRDVGNAAIQGGGIGAMQPATGDSSFKGQKAAQTVMGALGGAIVRPIEGAVKTLAGWLSSLKGDAALEDKAVKTILTRIKESEKGGGPTLQDMLDLINTAPGKPWLLADMPSANLKALVGKLARSPGEAKQIMQSALTDRDLNASLRIHDDIAGSLGEGSIAYTQEALQHARSIMAKEPFEKAYEGGSLAPLRQQFEDANAEAGKAEFEAAREVAHAETRITEAARREQQAGDNVYGVNGAREDRRAAEAQRAFAQDKLSRAQAEKQQISEVMRQAQEDMESGKKGAVWSPRIQEYLDNPRVKQGIQRGLIIERDKALNERRPMNTSEYANGEAVVGKVPTMRLLAVAKEGLDAMVYSDQFRNQVGQLDKEGVEIDRMRRGLVAELDRLNPDYKAARNIWAGKSDAMDAMKRGQDIFKMEPEAIESMVHGSSPDALRKALKGRVPDDVIEEAVARAKQGMTDSEKEFFKLGAAAKIRDIIETTGEKGDESRRLILAKSEKQLRALFDSDEEFNKFFKSLNAEHLMFKTWAKAFGGSETAERQADDVTKEAMGAAHIGLGLIEGARGSFYAPFHLARGWEKLRPKNNPALEAAQARLATSPAAGAVQKLQAAEAQMGTAGPSVTPYLVPPVVYGTEPKHAAGATQGMNSP